MKIRVMVSRHSAFYSPLISTLAAGFLDEAGHSSEYSVLGAGQRSHELIRDGVVDIMQSAVSSNWKPMDRGQSPLPAHFALINRRDGFFLAGHAPDAAFEWKKLEGSTLLADHGLQPLVMLRYAAHYNGIDWSKINVVDRNTPDEMLEAFRRGEGDYVHLQAPGPQILEETGAGATVVSVGASMPEVAFSTLCCSREFMQTEPFRDFVRAYAKAREWVRQADPVEVAVKEAGYFPGVSRDGLAGAISRYQKLGNWDGGMEITKELYEQALNVFEYSGEVTQRYPWGSVCGTLEE